MVSLSINAACFGRCSHRSTPGSLVGMVANGPRISDGASGLTSQVSMWLGPPAIQSRMTALRPPIAWPAAAASERARNRSGNVSPAIPANPALSVERRLTTVNPSRSRACKPENAWREVCSAPAQRCIENIPRRKASVRKKRERSKPASAAQSRLLREYLSRFLDARRKPKIASAPFFRETSRQGRADRREPG